MSSLYETLHSNPQIFISVRQWGTWPNLEQFQKKNRSVKQKTESSSSSSISMKAITNYQPI